MRKKLFSLLLLSGLLSTQVFATNLNDKYPERTVKINIGFPPGTSTDSVARILSDGLSKKWDQPVIVENKPGVGGSLAVSNVKRAKADGYTLVLSATAPMNINPHIYDDLKYDALSDFEFIGQTTWLPFMLVTNNKNNLDSLEKILEEASNSPDKLTFATTGIGTTSHLLMELLMSTSDTKLRHIPYKGSGEAQKDIIAGNVDMTFDTVVSTAPHVKDKKLNAIAVSTAERADLAPDVPTLKELGMDGFNLGAWLGLFAPKGTSKEILDKVHNDLNEVLNDPKIKKDLIALGSEVVSSPTRDDFKKMVTENYHSWGELVESANIE